MSESKETIVSKLAGAGNRAGLVNAQAISAMDREVSSTIASVLATIEKMPAKIKPGIMASAQVYIDRINTYLHEAESSRDRSQAAHMAYQDARMRFILSSKNLGNEPLPKKGRVSDMKEFKAVLDNAKAMSDALDERAMAGETSDRMTLEIRSALNELIALTLPTSRSRPSALSNIKAN